jgi:hypothetical protein
MRLLEHPSFSLWPSVKILIFTAPTLSGWEDNEVNEGALRCALALIFLSFGWSIENGGLAHPSFSLWPSVRILIFTEGNEVNEGALRCALALIYGFFSRSFVYGEICSV